MSQTILTLFGEEIVPEPVEAPAKGRIKTKLQEEEEIVAPDDMEVKPAETVAVKKTTRAKRVKKAEAENPLVESLDNFEGEKQYYSIGEVAALFKVKTSNIRFWTTEFAMKVRTTRKGDRLYTPAQIREMRTIHHLVKDQGFTINGAKTRLKSSKNRDVETIDLKQSLLQLRNKLITMRNQLK